MNKFESSFKSISIREEFNSLPPLDFYRTLQGYRLCELKEDGKIKARERTISGALVVTGAVSSFFRFCINTCVTEEEASAFDMYFERQNDFFRTHGQNKFSILLTDSYNFFSKESASLRCRKMEEIVHPKSSQISFGVTVPVVVDKLSCEPCAEGLFLLKFEAMEDS